LTARPLVYRPDIDGLRAVSVLGVLFYHNGLGVSGGYVGVDVFFVISGFLITSLIRKETDAGTFAIVSFWERRVRRIFPAMIVMMFAVLTFGSYVLSPRDLKALATSAIAQTLSASNFYFWYGSGYFDESSAIKPLLHTWSLSVEEQFYIALPLLLIALRRRSLTTVTTVILTIMVVSFSLSAYGAYTRPSTAFFLLPFRAWELLVGAALTFVPQSVVPPKWLNELAACGGICGVIVPMFIFDAETVFPGLSALLPVGGAALVIFTGRTAPTSLSVLLSLRPVVAVGLISYSLYLWHWPILVFSRHATSDFDLRSALLRVVASVLLAALSWRLVEIPFRRKSVCRSRYAVFAFALCGLLVVIAFGTAVRKFDGWPTRFSKAMQVFVDDLGRDGNDLAYKCQGAFNINEFPRLGVSDPRTRRVDFVVWGDSHAMVLFDLFDQLAKERSLSGRIIASFSTPPVPNLWNGTMERRGPDAARVNDAIFRSIKSEGIKHVILVARWSLYVEGTNRVEKLATGDNENQLVTDSESTVRSHSNAMDALSRQMWQLALQCRSAGIKLWVLRQVPEAGENDVARQVFMWKRFPLLNAPPIKSGTRADYLNGQELLDRCFKLIATAGARICDSDRFCFDAMGRTINFGDRACYRDRNHLTRYGAERFLRPIFVPVFQEIAGAD
jgi:peptidoglycan/LPS O-acetylase OafA/YrhL